MKATTLADAFAHFGTYPDNPRWSWSAVSPDLKTVAVTIWEHEVGVDGSIGEFGHPNLSEWASKPGNRERIRNFKIARDNAGGLFHVIWVTARDIDETPWKIGGRYTEDHYMMQLVDLDESTGEFSAVLVDPATASHERRTMLQRPVTPPIYSSASPAVRSRAPRRTQRDFGKCPTCHMGLPATGVCDNCD